MTSASRHFIPSRKRLTVRDAARTSALRHYLRSVKVASCGQSFDHNNCSKLKFCVNIFQGRGSRSTQSLVCEFRVQPRFETDPIALIGSTARRLAKMRKYPTITLDLLSLSRLDVFDPLEATMEHQSPKDGREPAVPPSDRVLSALRLLFDGFQYASDLGTPLFEFAVSLETMQRFAVAEIDIFWLTRKGFALAFCDGAPLSAERAADFCPETRFIVSSEGIRYAKEVFELRLVASEPEVRVPTWDSSHRKLKLGESVVKRFHVPAPNQELILQSFQEDGWPPQIEDPIPPLRNVDQRRRLHDTILALNRCQTGKRIRFRGDGTGVGVYWELDS